MLINTFTHSKKITSVFIENRYTTNIISKKQTSTFTISYKIYLNKTTLRKNLECDRRCLIFIRGGCGLPTVSHQVQTR